jgi:anthranilate phosphoribosyltransferase
VSPEGPSRLRDALHRVLAGESLDEASAQAALAEIMSGEASESLVAGYLVALRMKGETAEEIAGSVRALRAAQTPLDIGREPLVDTCGTGGDGSGTFNISTAAGLVAAAAGAVVAKHGNRSVSSRCGSADVLGELGLPVDVEPDRARRLADRHGFVFLLAPRYHGAIRHAMPARSALATRTLFNALGPLANPAGARRQVVGVYSDELLERAADALSLLGTERAYVVRSEDGLDEISISAPTDVIEVARTRKRRFRVAPEDFGVPRASREAIAGGESAENARILTAVFGGERGPRRDVVVINAAMALMAADLAEDPAEGVAKAAAAIDGGRVTALVEALRSEAAAT